MNGSHMAAPAATLCQGVGVAYIRKLQRDRAALIAALDLAAATLAPVRADVAARCQAVLDAVRP